MTELTDLLRRLNRKERFYLVGTALGNTDFRLADDFRDSVESLFGIAIPRDTFVAMDFHIEWLYAALEVFSRHTSGSVPVANSGVIRGNQEDVDLLIAFDAGSTTHLAMLEAKATGSFTNKQMGSKTKRLSTIFGRNGDAYPRVVPHFGLISPRRPRRLDCGSWPAWAADEGKPRWLPLSLPEDLMKVTRCDGAGKQDRDGGHWKLEPDT